MPEKNVIKKTALSPTILLVGGAGFIGSHLAEALLKKNARVVVLDNFSTGKDVYVHGLLDNPKFALFNVDINEGLPKEIQSVDYIFQLAGLETYLFDKEDLSLDSLLTNALGNKNILDFAKKSEAKLLLGSTIDVYKGMISPLNLDQYFGQTAEEEKKFSLIEAKRYAEALVWEYYKHHNVDVRIVRLPEVYGPRMNPESCGSLGMLIKSLVDDKDLIVYGEGSEKEYYLYIEDAISGLVKALFTENTKGKIYTFVSEEPHTVLETTYLIKSLANREARVVFKPYKDRITSSQPHIPDLSNLKDLNWSEKITFKEGIGETLKWFGYEPNAHAFKPAKILEEKQSESKSNQRASILSLVDFGSKKVIEKKQEPEHTEKIAEKVPLVKEKVSKKRWFSKIKFKKKTQAEPKLKSTYQVPSSNEAKPSKTRFLPKLGAILLILITILALFIGIPTIQTYLHTKKGISALELVKRNLESLDTQSAQTNANEAFKEFYSAQVSLKRLDFVFSTFGQKEYFNNAQSLLESAQSASKAVYFIAKGSTPYENFWQTLKPNSSETFDTEAFNKSKSDFITAQNNLRLAVAGLKQVNYTKFPVEVKNYSDLIEDTSESLDILVAVSSGMPDLVGLDGSRKYLILLQNSNEIRATGGFIGSYAILELENGKIADLLIDDVYNPDGQLDLREIQVTPPDPIALYLKEDKLHIRNANWDADFVKSAEKIEDLFFKIDGREFDGVIAVDLNFVANLLEVTGPVYLTAYNEEITAANLYERTQFHSEFNYINGSDQKRSFLTVLGGKMLEKVFALDKGDLVKLSDSIVASFEQKHLLVSISDNPISPLLLQNKWTGQLVKPEGDYLYVVNSNLGGTKANYYVENSMNYAVFSKTRDGLLRAELTLNYNHTGKDNSWPGGPYTDYVRVLTKPGTKLTGAKLIVNDDSIADISNIVSVGTESGFTTFEFPFVIDPQSQARLVFEYDLPEDMVLTKESNAYSLYWQKQPGTSADPISFSFNAPFGFSIVDAIPTMSTGTSTASYSGTLITDLDLALEFN